MKRPEVVGGVERYWRGAWGERRGDARGRFVRGAGLLGSSGAGTTMLVGLVRPASGMAEVVDLVADDAAAGVLCSNVNDPPA